MSNFNNAGLGDGGMQSAREKQKVTIEASVELDFPDGKRTIEMALKQSHEIQDCEEGKAVCLNLKNGETHTGIFKGMDGDDDVKLGTLSGDHTLGYKVNWIDDYLEEI